MKKRTIYKTAFILVCIIAVWCFITLQSTTKQAIDYQNREFKIPLYLKTIDFIDRHLNYRWTVHQIVNVEMTEQEKVKAIFQWTTSRIARQPKQLPVIDDHVWHIIVRGYGMDDQMADVFATLSNYSGFKAFILHLKGFAGTVPNQISLGAVHFDGAWHICGLYRRSEFLNRQGRWATIDEIITGDWTERGGNDSIKSEESLDYKKYFQSLKTIDFEALYQGSRSSIQGPVKRFLHFFHSKKPQ